MRVIIQILVKYLPLFCCIAISKVWEEGHHPSDGPGVHCRLLGARVCGISRRSPDWQVDQGLSGYKYGRKFYARQLPDIRQKPNIRLKFIKI